MDFHVDPSRFTIRFASLPRTPSPDDAGFELARAGRVSIHWAPFDYVPSKARLVLVGITPGWQQAADAHAALHAALRKHSMSDALRIAKRSGSFSGAMRGNLVDMLDMIGVQHLAGLETCAEFFGMQDEQVHFTSALRYPVFVDGANYNGTPDMLRTPLLRGMVETCLAAELRALPDALVLPLGPKPAVAVQHLVQLGVLSADQVLEGLPHPSGANGERISYFLGRKAKEALSTKTKADTIDLARSRLQAQVRRLQRR